MGIRKTEQEIVFVGVAVRNDRVFESERGEDAEKEVREERSEHQPAQIHPGRGSGSSQGDGNCPIPIARYFRYFHR